MIHQGAPDEEPFWSVPAGRVEDGELVTEGLVREVLEETGLEILDPGRLAFVFQIDNRRAEALHESRGRAGGYFATVWTFDVGDWRGTLAPDDPDGVVREARFMPAREAIAHLESLEWQSATVSYLRGDLDVGSVVAERWHADGAIERVAPIPGDRSVYPLR
jgi:ADP-ribose pyrophosphatase YjhB (NUDIX family)